MKFALRLNYDGKSLVMWARVVSRLSCLSHDGRGCGAVHHHCHPRHHHRRTGRQTERVCNGSIKISLNQKTNANESPSLTPSWQCFINIDIQWQKFCYPECGDNDINSTSNCGVLIYQALKTSQGPGLFAKSVLVNSLRLSDAHMRQWTNHHWFR